MSPYYSEGTYTSESREVAISETWDTWANPQASSNVEVVDGSLQLAEFTGPPESDTVEYQYDALQLSGFSDGDVVSSWPDPNVSNMTLTGSGTYRESGIAGNPVVEFDGSSDGFSNYESTLSRPFGFVIVLRTDSLSSGEENIISPADDNSDRGKLIESGGQWAGFAFSTVSGSSSTSVRLVSFFVEGDTGYIREDGSETGVSSGQEEGTEPLGLGFEAANERRYWEGQIGFAEIHQGLTYSEIQSRESEIASYWGLSI